MTEVNAEHPPRKQLETHLKRLILLAVLLLAGYFAVLPMGQWAWDKVSYDPPPAMSDSEIQESYEGRFIPDRVVRYPAIIGTSPVEAEQLLGYGTGQNLYPVAPVLVGNFSIGDARPEDYRPEDLTIVAVCQTITPERAFTDGGPRLTDDDRIYFSTYPTNEIPDDERKLLDGPDSVERATLLSGWGSVLEQQQADCNPNGIVASVAVLKAND